MEGDKNLTNVIFDAYNELKKQTRETKENSYYFRLEVHFLNESRIYICLCPILDCYTLVHEEFDDDSNLDNTKVLSEEKIKEYIENIDPNTIEIVVSNLTPSYDQKPIFQWKHESQLFPRYH